MKTVAYIPQVRGGLLTKATIACGIDALYTDGLSTCNIIALISESKAYPFHADFNSNKMEIKEMV